MKTETKNIVYMGVLNAFQVETRIIHINLIKNKNCTLDLEYDCLS